MSSDTIEPALLARSFHDDTYDQIIEASALGSGQLPPLREVVGHDVPSRRNDTSKHNEQSTASSFSSQNNGLSGPTSSQEILHLGSGTQQVHGISSTNRALGDSSPQSLRKILGKDTDTTVGRSSKKRPNAEPAKDDFVQLPQPPKKQKTATQIVPPIISGLHDIPAATVPYKFPRIESGAFHDSNGRNSLNTGLPPTIIPAPQNDSNVGIVVSTIESQEPIAQEAKRKRKVNGQRRKWGKEETEWVIQGAHRHGVGSWTDVLNDPEYPFVNRTAGDLKDRFRTVCPSGVLRDLERRSLTPSGPEQENPVSKSLKFRGHRKNVVDLNQLGIETPFKKSDRRDRRMFTEEEDREILRAHSIYGTQWARISRDSQFSFQERTSTDLRDRFRNIRKSREKASPPRQSSRKTLEKPCSGETLSGGHPSSSLAIPNQEPLALQSSTLNSGEPRIPEALSRHPSSSDLHSQSQGVLKPMEPWTKETTQEFRNREGILNANISSVDTLQAQGTSNKANEPWMKESTSSSRSKYDLSNGYHPASDLDLRAISLSKTDETWAKDSQVPATTHQPSGISIQEIISTEQQDPRTSLFTFSETSNPYPEHPLETSESLPYTQGLDWNSNMSIPTLINDVDPSRLTNSSGYGEMDVQRILQNGWEGDMADSSVQGLSGKGKPSFTDINSILSTNDEPTMGSQQPSFFTNLLNADGPLALDDQPVWS
ncbi:hypothetical protein ONS95_001649 [Cadophora gregata]|uniref:uncharacterized protein n=1 Tax=Cadophora gregata TaxID=51156 RepID=UPI0026DCEDA3|nr:uncharacterized protein ONS95_001649 [Cadophora gregata]KAK0111277.1 hypothetical protein ONS95_001649 [Cadophora gregata]KAK0112250.1 hypothetical protein ONS96_001499 [Cadophora gregata f. sp. sojae]